MKRVTLKEKIDFFKNKGLVPLSGFNGIEDFEDLPLNKYLHFTNELLGFSEKNRRGVVSELCHILKYDNQHYRFIEQYTKAVYLLTRFEKEGGRFWANGEEVFQNCKRNVELVRTLINIQDMESIKRNYFDLLHDVTFKLNSGFGIDMGKAPKNWESDIPALFDGERPVVN